MTESGFAPSSPESGAASVVLIARCPEHGLHGERDECFVCHGPVEQVPMVPVSAPSPGLDARDLAIIWHALHQADLPDDWPVAAVRVKIGDALHIGETCEACGNKHGVPDPSRFACPTCWEIVA